MLDNVLNKIRKRSQLKSCLYLRLSNCKNNFEINQMFRFIEMKLARTPDSGVTNLNYFCGICYFSCGYLHIDKGGFVDISATINSPSKTEGGNILNLGRLRRHENHWNYIQLLTDV